MELDDSQTHLLLIISCIFLLFAYLQLLNVFPPEWEERLTRFLLALFFATVLIQGYNTSLSVSGTLYIDGTASIIIWIVVFTFIFYLISGLATELLLIVAAIMFLIVFYVNGRDVITDYLCSSVNFCLPLWGLILLVLVLTAAAVGILYCMFKYVLFLNPVTGEKVTLIRILEQLLICLGMTFAVQVIWQDFYLSVTDPYENPDPTIDVLDVDFTFWMTFLAVVTINAILISIAYWYCSCCYDRVKIKKVQHTLSKEELRLIADRRQRAQSPPPLTKLPLVESSTAGIVIPETETEISEPESEELLSEPSEAVEYQIEGDPKNIQPYRLSYL